MEGVVWLLPKIEAGIDDAPGPRMVFLLGLTSESLSAESSLAVLVGGGVERGMG